MAKQIVNIGTSANKGDGDPLRSAFDKINDNFNEVYPRLDSLEVANNSSGNMIEQSIIGSVFGSDSTQLIDGLNSTVNGPISSENWTRNGNIAITVSSGTLALQATTGDTDYIKIGANIGVNIFSNSNIGLNTVAPAAIAAALCIALTALPRATKDEGVTLRAIRPAIPACIDSPVISSSSSISCFLIPESPSRNVRI